VVTFVHRPSLWIAGAIAVAIAVVAWLQWRGPAVEVTSPVRRDLEQHLVASGRVRVPVRVQIAAQLGGLITAVHAVEGQHVAAGDVLVELDAQVARAEVAQAEAAANQASARVDQLRRVGRIVATAALGQAQTTVAQTKADLDRAAKLAATGAVPGIELENAQHAYDIAIAQRTAAQAQQLASAPSGDDSRIALTALMQAQAQLAAARVRVDQARIVALHPATVLSRAVEPGDVVEPSRTLLVLADDAPAQLSIDADERDLASIRIGQHARASADAYPQAVFDAVVSYVAPAIDASRGSVEVRLDVSEPQPFLRPDMTVSIDLAVAARRNALTLPSEAVHGATTPAPWVEVVDDDRVSRRDVVLGIRGDGRVEIVRGVDEGSDVILPGGAPLPEGTRVRL
jgi:HlyD family secretion protein